MSNRWRAITWTNVDPVHWHIYAALGGDELSYGNGGYFGQVPARLRHHHWLVIDQLSCIHLSAVEDLDHKLHITKLPVMANFQHYVGVLLIRNDLKWNGADKHCGWRWPHARCFLWSVPEQMPVIWDGISPIMMSLTPECGCREIFLPYCSEFLSKVQHKFSFNPLGFETETG